MAESSATDESSAANESSATDESTYSSRPPDLGPRKWYQSPFVWAAVAGIITIPLLRPCLRRIPEPPAVIAVLPEFELVDQDGEPFGSAQLRGQVYIANTFFTHCQTVCPPLMQGMAGLQERIEREVEARRRPVDIRLVSISVDPFNDTPERLREYAADYGVDFDRWTLLTGPEADLRELIIGGFMTDMGQEEVDPQNANLMHISHTAKLVLVDPFGRIRGYYDSDESGFDEVFNRATHVLRVRDDEAEAIEAARGGE